MKTLLFFRHGKSDWDADYHLDHERPLAKRGRKAAKKMGGFLAQANLIPDHVLCSTAVRARSTLEIAQEAGNWNTSVHLTPALYHAAPSTLLREIRAQQMSTNILMLVGHEPTWSETIEHFIGGGLVRFPTAAMACIELDIASWHNAALGQGLLRWLVPPKILS